MKKDTPAKIFIVEDEPFFANLINYDLEANYFDGIKTFFSGEECLKHIDLKPKVVILDHQLPGISGLEVLKKIKALDPKIHVIFLSGEKNAQLAIGAFKQGALDFISKGENALMEVKELLEKILKSTSKKGSDRVSNSISKPVAKTANKKITQKPAATKTVAKKNASKPAATKTATKKSTSKPAANKTVAKKSASKPATTKTATKKSASKPATTKMATKKSASSPAAKTSTKK